MTPLHEKVARQLGPHRDRPLIVAFSGGGDSMALLHLLRDLELPVVAAHLDHALRPESGAQVETLRQWSNLAGAEFLTQTAPVAVKARRWGLGLEAAGRRLRYAWLRRLAEQRQALILTGHTMDDVAETVLMRVLSGTSPSGLAGPRRQRGQWLLRPLLELGREELRAYLRAGEIDWLEDPSNRDPRFLRNWVRQDLIPLLEERNPRVTQALQRLAQASGELREWTCRKAKRSPTQLRDAPLDVRFQSWACAWRAGHPQPGTRFTRCHFQLCEEWLQGGGSRLQLPGGMWVYRTPTDIRFVKTPLAPLSAETLELNVSGLAPWGIDLPQWGLRLSIEPCLAAQSPTPWRADLASPPGRWQIRARRPGDRFGSAKLKKYFLQWGVTLDQRSEVPLLCDDYDRPFWAVGHRVRKEYLATPGQPGWRFHFSPQGD